MDAGYKLISHQLCPFVQRAAIVLAEKGVAFERIDIDLNNKPEWFLKLSPLGKVPMLVVNGEPIFESSVICEYLDDTIAPKLHPEDPLIRARHRGWMEFAGTMHMVIGVFYNAADELTMNATFADLRNRLEQLEAELRDGPYFIGARFTLVDAVFGPVFRYFDVFDVAGELGFFNQLPRVAAWRRALMSRASVKQAVGVDYVAAMRDLIRSRNTALSKRFADA